MQKLKHYAYMCHVLAWNQVKVRYKNSILGVLWGFLNPLGIMYIFIFVFSSVFVEIENYPLYLLSGLIFWYFFTNASNEIVFSFIKGQGIIKSLSIPRSVLPLSGILSSFIHLLFTLFPFFIVMNFYGLVWSWHIFLLIPALVLFTIFIFGLCLALASVNVYFRDISMLWSTLLMFIFYSSPIVYGRTIVPDRFSFIVKFNPISYYMELFRSALYYNRIAAIDVWLIATAFSFSFLLVGFMIYRKLRKGFVSNLG